MFPSKFIRSLPNADNRPKDNYRVNIVTRVVISFK